MKILHSRVCQVLKDQQKYWIEQFEHGLQICDIWKKKKGTERKSEASATTPRQRKTCSMATARKSETKFCKGAV